jgi:hypothetical protein
MKTFSNFQLLKKNDFALLSANPQLWFSQETQVHMIEKTLSCFCFKEPFVHYHVPNFLSEFALKLLNSSIKTSYPYLEPVTEHDPHLFAPIAIEEIVRFFYGSEFRGFLKGLTGEGLRWRGDFFPQIRVFPAGSSGLRIHTDKGVDYHYASFLNLGELTDFDQGGELVLWGMDDNRECQIRKIIPTTPNSLTVIKFCADGYHSVAPVSSCSDRVNILCEWVRS